MPLDIRKLAASLSQVAAVCIGGLVPTYHELQDRIDWQVVATVVSEHAAAGDAIIRVASPQEIQQMYLDVEHYVAIGPHPVALVTQPPAEPLQGLLPGSPGG